LIDKVSNVAIMAELKLLLQDGPLPRKFLKRQFKEKGLTERDLQTGEELMGLVEEKWNGVLFVRLPGANEQTGW